MQTPFRFFYALHNIVIMIADFHNDYLTEGGGALSCIAEKAELSVCALYRGNRSDGQIGELLARFARERAENQFLGLEDAGYICRTGIESVPPYALVYASPTCNYENELAGGCLEDTGLKRAGREAVLRFAECGIAIDCAHLGKRAFSQVIELTDKVVDSHTCAAALYPHRRNLEDWQIGEIVRCGGLIGIAFVGAFLSECPTAEDIFRHTDHCVQKFGCKNFCFGTDFFGTKDLPDGLASYEACDGLRGFFIKAGYSAEDIKRIFIGNLRDFICKK